MESLLAEIDQTEDTDRLLESVLLKLVETFGEELQIFNGRLYAGGEDGFTLVKTKTDSEGHILGIQIPLDYPPTQLLLQHKLYIFDQSTPGVDPKLEEQLGGIFSVAILVNGPDRPYVLAFGLREEWDREMLEFSLNTIRNLINHRFTEVRFQSKLMEAREIQQSLLPPPKFVFNSFDIFATSVPAEEVGGDFYDFFPVPGQNIVLAIGDSSGHGLTAALQVRDVVIGLRMGMEKEFKIASVVERLNRLIHRSTLSTRFISLFMGELDENGDLFYINAGHVPPVLFDKGTISTLTIGGLPLGPVPEVSYRRGYVHIPPGAVLVCYTDGIEERLSPEKIQFGVERLTRVVKKNMDLSAEQLVDAIMNEAARFGKKTEWDDDATIIVIKRAEDEEEGTVSSSATHVE